MTAKAAWYFTSRITATRVISTSVGSTLNSMKVRRKLMPREPVQVADELQGDATERALGDLGDNRVAQLAEGRAREAHGAVADQKGDGQDQHRIARDVELIDDAFQHQRDGDGSGLGQDQAAYGPQHPGAVFPEVGEEAADGLQVAT